MVVPVKYPADTGHCSMGLPKMNSSSNLFHNLFGRVRKDSDWLLTLPPFAPDEEDPPLPALPPKQYQRYFELYRRFDLYFEIWVVILSEVDMTGLELFAPSFHPS